jgi:hypothetical protein
MTRRQLAGNVGEWSEIFALFKILNNGVIYAADANAQKIDDSFLRILKVIREENRGHKIEYRLGQNIQIWEGNQMLVEVDRDQFRQNSEIIFEKFFTGRDDRTGSFAVDEVTDFLEHIHIEKLKAPSTEKVDIMMQINDVASGMNPIVGFSIKSDIGALPTLLNPGNNTRFRYKIDGITDDQMDQINSLSEGNYAIERMRLLFQYTNAISFHSMNGRVFKENLMYIDMRMPEIYAEMILAHYKNMNLINCVDLVDELMRSNPLDLPNTDLYKYKLRRLLVASALGMTPGANWHGGESTTGGYLLVKKNGDILYYHLYNRNLFEDYLLNNTKFDRPSMTRYDYGYIFKIEDEYFIDFNIQIRFRSPRRR